VLGATRHRSVPVDSRSVQSPLWAPSSPPSRWDFPRDEGLDGLDLVVSRAARDASFRRRLLIDPLGALMLADIPLPLKHRLTGIRASSLGDFALQGLLAEADLMPRARARPARGPAGDGVA
jgi:hypothetical protein